MPDFNEAAEYLKSRGMSAEAIAAQLAGNDQAEAWLLQAAPIAMHARQHGNAGEYAQMGNTLAYLVPLFQQLGVDPHSPAGVVINQLLARGAQMAELLGPAPHITTIPDLDHLACVFEELNTFIVFAVRDARGAVYLITEGADGDPFYQGVPHEDDGDVHVVNNSEIGDADGPKFPLTVLGGGNNI